MANRLTILGGSNWVDGEVLYANDLVNTIGLSINESVKGVAAIPYWQTVQDSSYKNNGTFFAEHITNNPSGVNFSIVPGSTTAKYNNNIIGSYFYNLNNSDINTRVAQTSKELTSFIISGSIKADGYFSYLNVGSGAGFPLSMNLRFERNGSIVYFGSGLNASPDFLNLGSYTQFYSSGDTFRIVGSTNTGSGIIGESGTSQTYAGSYFNIWTTTNWPDRNTTNTLFYTASNLQNSGNVFFGRTTSSVFGTISGITILNGTEKNITLFANGSYIGSDLTFTVSDYSNSVSEILPNNITNISSLTAGSLIVTANLRRATGGSYSPVIKGIGGYLS